MIYKKTQELMAKASLIFVSTVFSFQSISFSTMEDKDMNTSREFLKVTQTTLFPATSMPDSDWWHTLWPDPKSVVQSLGVKKGAITVDLCCGDGYFSIPLAEISSKVYGIEFVADLLQQAEKEAKTRQLTNFKWIQADAMKLSELILEPVDFVLVANTFHGIPDKEVMGKNISSILKPEGKLCIINWHKKPREETTVLGLPRGPKSEMRMAPKDVEEVLLPVGFVLESLVEFPPYHYGAIFKKAEGTK